MSRPKLDGAGFTAAICPIQYTLTGPATFLDVVHRFPACNRMQIFDRRPGILGSSKIQSLFRLISEADDMLENLASENLNRIST
jgi:hypothetical protein